MCLASLAIYPSFATGFQVKDATTDIRVLALADFAFAVEVPYRFRQGLEYIWSFSSQDIVNVVYGGDVRFSALESSRDAEQAYQIRVVGMKVLAIVVSVERYRTRDPLTDSGHTVHWSDRF